MRKNKLYTELLQYAYKVARRTDEAEDLLQNALLAAIEAGRADISCMGNRRWLMGVLRKQSAFDARTALRRRKREASLVYADNSQVETRAPTTKFVRTLPLSLKTTALLALTGCTKAEVAWLLRVSDTALRQRIVEIKRRWRHYDGRHVSEVRGLKEGLAYGRIRQALLKVARRDKVILSSHDPDGHLFSVTSQNDLLRQHRMVSTNNEGKDNV